MDRSEGTVNTGLPEIVAFFGKFVEMMDDSGHGSCEAVAKSLGDDKGRMSSMRTYLQGAKLIALGTAPIPQSVLDNPSAMSDKITEEGLMDAKKKGFLIGVRDFSGTKLRTVICDKCCARHALLRSIPRARLGKRADFRAAVREDAERHRKRVAAVTELVKPEGYDVVDCSGAVDFFRCHRCKWEIELPEYFWDRYRYMRQE